MPARTLFPTRIYTAKLTPRAADTLNARLLRECRQLALDDGAGRAWSRTNYPGGYTSYSSASRMHQMSPTFAQLQKRIDAHVRRFANSLDFDLTGRGLEMTDCWVNVMARHVVHGLHLHPLASISGTYYVRTPRGCSGLKFEDPRLDRYMAAPPRKERARRENQLWVTLPAEQGTLVLFESWLRHEVAPNPTETERISVSFNYSWF
ncbi:MAG TPA: TIGR02466 family protein [Steroidobacteraceae bacterium]|jgi:uncharacterized protein (TIGR02466 family)|nr:TIGR02466 family protein [Steroidobacteraceae bacterium]